MIELPDLSQYDRIAFDTETTGLGYDARPVGLSISTPDQRKWYFAWGHGDPAGLKGPADFGNNIDLPSVVRWAARELTRPGCVRVGHNAMFDLRMLAYVGIRPTNVECTQYCATLLNEHRASFKLNDIAYDLGIGTKADDKLFAWMVEKLKDDKGNALKPTGRSCGPHYWRVPVPVIQEYAEHDPVLTLGVYDRLRSLIAKEGLERVYALENALMPVLIRMHLTGVRIDRPRTIALKAEILDELRRAQDHWFATHGDVNYRSGDQLGPIFDSLGIKYPRTPITKKPSIKAAWLDALDHPIGEQLRTMRKLQYFADTVIDNSFLSNTTEEDDVIHGEFHSMRGEDGGTRFGRLSSSGALNLQNIPARDKGWAPRIRGVFRPMRDDQVWGRFDYSQIEYRFFAHYAGVLARRNDLESAMENAYIENPDVDFHQWVADTAGIERKPAKNVNFCRLYGGGVAKIALTAGVTVEQAQEFVNAYDAKIPEAKALMKDIDAVAARRGYVVTWMGRKCRFLTEGEAALRYNRQPDGNPNRRSKTYTGLNRVLQGSSADLTKVAMVEIDKVLDWSDNQMHLTVHDELDFSLFKGTAQAFSVVIKEMMQDLSRTPDWRGEVMRVPVRVEAEIGNNWGMTE